MPPDSPDDAVTDLIRRTRDLRAEAAAACKEAAAARETVRRVMAGAVGQRVMDEEGSIG